MASMNHSEIATHGQPEGGELELPATSQPVFVIGALRSGTSMVTAALGQHPNLRPVGENSWMLPFARGLRRSFEASAERRDVSQLEAAGIDLELFFLYFGEAIDRLMLHPPVSVEKLPTLAGSIQKVDNETSSPYPGVPYRPDRWVDGTLEHTWNAINLWRMFPRAKFIHVVRDVDEVVNVLTDPDTRAAFRSRTLVLNQDDALRHWLDASRAGLQAERLLGSVIVLRVRRADLMHHPETEMRRILAFLGEPFDPRVLRLFR